MMVEAEATENDDRADRRRRHRADRGGRRQGLEAAKPFIRELCRAQAELAEVAAKPVAEFPVFLDYQDDVYAAVEPTRSRPSSPRR